MHVQRRIIFTGRVQGVGFRATTIAIAQQFRVTGWVRNEPDGSVLCVAEGESAELKRFRAAIEQEMGRYIRDVRTEEREPTGEFADFSMRFVDR